MACCHNVAAPFISVASTVDTTGFILVYFPSIPSRGGELEHCWLSLLLCFGVAASVQVYLLLQEAGSKGTLKWKGLGFMLRSRFLAEFMLCVR